MSIARQARRESGAAQTRLELEAAVLPVAPHVLVAGDEPDTLDATSSALREAGFQVSVAASGAAARLGLQETEFDMVILGVMLSDVSAIDLLREIRVDADVPVIRAAAIPRRNGFSASSSGRTTT